MHLPHGAAQSVDLRFFKQTDGSRKWHSMYNNPQISLIIKGFDLANRSLLGHGIGAAICFSAPILQGERYKMYGELAAGPGYVSKPFDLQRNYKNIAIGSHGNVFIMLGQRFIYALTPQFHFSVAASFNHFSNAAFALPNLGLNYPTISTGIAYTPNFLKNSKLDTTTTQHPSSDFLLESFWSITSAFGIKEAIRPHGAKYPAFSLSADRNAVISRKSSIAFGVDVFNNLALLAYRTHENEDVNTWTNSQLGAHIGYGLHIDALQIGIQMGAYVLDTYKRDGLLYHRVAMRYFMTEHIGMNLSLKTHFFKADYFEAGICFRI